MFHRCLAVVSSVAIALGSAAIWTASPALAEPTTAGHQGITVTEAPFGTFGRTITAAYYIDAPPAAVFDVLTDYAHMGDFMPMVDEAKALRVDSNGATVSYRLRYLRFFDIIEIDERVYDRPRRITWHATQGPLKVSDGSWSLTPRGKGTHVLFQTDVDPGIPIPSALTGALMKRGLPEVLTAIRLRVESNGKWKKAD